MERLNYVKLSDITEGTRYREDYGDLTSLAESIKEKGVIQPITLSSQMELVAGGRRLRAAKQAGLSDIPALIRSISGEVDLREIELLENIERLDLSWLEKNKLIARIDSLYKEKNMDWSMRKTATAMDKGIAAVSRAIKLVDAVSRIPELAELKTEDEALKLIARLEEKVVVQELRKRQSSLDKGLQAMLSIADKSYRIGDTFKGMAGLPENGKIDIIECDPPYGISLNEVKRQEGKTSYVQVYNEIPEDKYEKFLAVLCKELYRVASRNCWLIFWYGPTWHTQVMSALRSADWQVDDIPAIWIKPTGQVNAPEYYLSRCYEPFFLARKGKPILSIRGRSNVFDFAPDAGQRKFHPTQRPLTLMQAILGTFGMDLQTVLVPFTGSGVTLRAAYRLGMKAFGWDISSEYKDKFMLEIENDTRALEGKENGG